MLKMAPAAAGDQQCSDDPADNSAGRWARTLFGKGVDDMLEDIDVVSPQQGQRQKDRDRSLDPFPLEVPGEDPPVEDRRQRRLEDDRDDKQEDENLADRFPIHIEPGHRRPSVA